MKKHKLLIMTALLMLALMITASASYAQDPDEYLRSYIPSDKELHIVQPKRGAVLQSEITIPDTLPERYRSDEQPWADGIRVKDQARTGLCWTFYLTTPAEYSYQKELYETTGSSAGLAELSPAHLGYFFYNRVNDPLGNTGGDFNSVQTDSWATVGGDGVYAMQHLAGWSGLGAETNTPFESVNDHIKNNTWDGTHPLYDDKYAYDDEIILENSIFLNNITDADKDLVKAIVLKYGSAGASIYIDRKYFNQTEKWPDSDTTYIYGRSFYNYNADTAANHAVTIVGWDDNYPKENFSHTDKNLPYSDDTVLKLTTPACDGAWIIQNSWGEDVHENGFFYMSYCSADITAGKNHIIALDMQSADTYRYNFMYDGSSCSYDTSDDEIGCETPDGSYAANVFENTTGEPVSVDAIGYTTYNYGPTEYTISIYKDLEDPKDPMSGILCGPATTAYSYYAGCKTAVLNEPVVIQPDESFAVVFGFHDDTAFGVEASKILDEISFAAGIDPGQSFYKESIDDDWYDTYNSDFCFRIKAFANTYTDQMIDSLTEDQKPHAVQDLVFSGEIQALVTAPENIPEGYEISYSINGGVSWTDDVPAATDAGKYRVICRYTGDAGKSLLVIPVTIDKKSNGAAAVLPGISTVSAIKDTVLEFDAAAGQEYYLADGINSPDWTKAVIPARGKFSEKLDPCCMYTLYTRIAETANVYAGAPASVTFAAAAEYAELLSEDYSDIELIGNVIDVDTGSESPKYIWYSSDNKDGSDPEKINISFVSGSQDEWLNIDNSLEGKYIYAAGYLGDIEVGRTRIAGPISYASVYFDTKGGSAVEPQEGLECDDPLIKPDDPVFDGRYFAGWYRDAGFETPWIFQTDLVTSVTTTLYAKWLDEPLVSYSGTVCYNNGLPAEDAAVWLEHNGVLTYATDTGKDGSFSLNAEKGVYQLYVFDGYSQYCDLLELNGDISGALVTLPPYGIWGEVNSSYAFEEFTLVGGLDGVVSGVSRKNGETEVYIVFELITENYIDQTDAAAFENDKNTIKAFGPAAGSSFEFFSMTIGRYGTIGNKEVYTDIGALNDTLLKIIIPYPTKGKSRPVIYRCHDGIAEALKKDPAPGEEGYVISGDTDEIIIYAMKFSTYAVGWGASSTDGGSGGSGGSGSGGGSASGGGSGSGVSAAASAVKTAASGTLLISRDVLSASKPAQTFSDVEPDRWSKPAVDFVVTRGIFNGNGDGTFGPSDPLSRGMIAQVFYNLAGKPAAGARSTFTDAESFLWFEDAISWAAEKGLINGLPDGSYDVNGLVTREQAAAILFRFAQACGYDTSARTELRFSDAGSVRAYSYEAMQWAAAKGLINGDGGRLLPDEAVTREQMAAIIMRFIRQYADL